MLVGIPPENIRCHLEISEFQPDCAISSASLNSLPFFCNSSKCLKVLIVQNVYTTCMFVDGVYDVWVHECNWMINLQVDVHVSSR